MLGRLHAEKKIKTSGASMKYDLYDGEFERERAWLLATLEEGVYGLRANAECGCCFDSVESASVPFYFLSFRF